MTIGPNQSSEESDPGRWMTLDLGMFHFELIGEATAVSVFLRGASALKTTVSLLFGSLELSQL